MENIVFMEISGFTAIIAGDYGNHHKGEYSGFTGNAFR